jgi:cysteine protease ATG4
MKGSKYTPAGSSREVSEQEIPINSELYAAFHLDFISCIWISYRSGFPPIRPSTLTSDAGWGCMLRCGQMVLSGSLIRIYVGRRWRFSNLKPPPRNYIEVIKMFADDPSAPFSIHNIARTGQERFNLPIGQWFSPTAVSDVMAYLAQVSPVADDLAIYVARDAAIYRSEVFKLAQTRHAGSLGDQGVDSSGRAASTWRSVLILVPLRLGSHDVNEDYLPQVQSVFSIPQCMGMLGGRPGSAFYYVASRGEELFYLDPHTTQRAVCMSGSYETSSYHCRVFRHMRSCDIDPSVCFCFLCSDEAAFNEVLLEIAWMSSLSGLTLIFHSSVRVSRLRQNPCRPSSASRRQPPPTSGECARSRCDVWACLTVDAGSTRTWPMKNGTVDEAGGTRIKSIFI